MYMVDWLVVGILRKQLHADTGNSIGDKLHAGNVIRKKNLPKMSYFCLNLCLSGSLFETCPHMP